MNFNEYITTLECAQSLAETVHELFVLWSRKNKELCAFARSKNMPWLIGKQPESINAEISKAIARHYDRNPVTK